MRCSLHSLFRHQAPGVLKLSNIYQTQKLTKHKYLYLYLSYLDVHEVLLPVLLGQVVDLPLLPFLQVHKVRQRRGFFQIFYKSVSCLIVMTEINYIRVCLSALEVDNIERLEREGVKGLFFV